MHEQSIEHMHCEENDKSKISIDDILCCARKTQRNSQFCFGETPI